MKKKVRKLIAMVLACSMTMGMCTTAVSAQANNHGGLDAPVFKDPLNLLKVYDETTKAQKDPTKSVLTEIYQVDEDTAASQYYMDQILQRPGEAAGDVNKNGNSDGNTFMTKGRALYMYTSDPRVIGFGGKTAFHQPLTDSAAMYSITLKSGGKNITLTEDKTKRVNYPSHWIGTYSGGGVTMKVSKFINYQNVAVTLVTLTNTSPDQEITLDMSLYSPFVSAYSDSEGFDELTGKVTSPGNLTQISTRMTGSLDGVSLMDSGTKGTLKGNVTLTAGATVEAKAVMAFTTSEIPESTEDYLRFEGLENEEALSAQKGEYNTWWKENVPYIDVPDKAVQKAIDYRWWLERYNTLDANIPGYDYQYPVTIEGILGYNNAIALTQPMHLQDLKWMRTPYQAYGTLLSVGNSSQSSAFLDNPGNRGNWNNHYGQYLGQAGMEAFYVKGGNTQLADTLAYYFYHDAQGQLDHYGNHYATDADPHFLIDYRNNYMTGNDADTISMHYTGIGTWKTHAENAYVFGAAEAAAQLYDLTGDSEKGQVAQTLADNIQKDILDFLWCEQDQTFETRAVKPTAGFEVHNQAKPNLVPWKENNNYNYFSMGVIPDDPDSIAKYGAQMKYLKDMDEYPIWPCFTANQKDNAEAVAQGKNPSNNFSNINFTLQARAYEEALRTYDTTHQYVTPNMLARLVEWQAWNVYPDSGDVTYPNNSEFFNIDDKTESDYYRSWIYHNILGNFNYIFIEDMAGIRPRSDDVIELDPIVDFNYDHFMVNNVRYRDKDLTVVWDKPGDGKTYYQGDVEGFSLYIDGSLAFTLDALEKVEYEADGTITTEATVTTDGTLGQSVAAVLDVEITDENVKAMLQKSGIELDIGENLAKGASVEASYTPAEARKAAWAEKHRADGTDATSKAVNETKPDPMAVTDGMTVNMPFWGNDKSTNASDSLVITLDQLEAIDMMNLYFYNDRQTGGYSEPARYLLEYWDSGDNQWKHMANQTRAPLSPRANYNVNLFDEVTTEKVRITFFNKPDYFTAVTEVQLYSEGGERDSVSNQTPVVTLREDTGKKAPLKAFLDGEIVDDGLPYDKDLTYTWEVTQKPEGAQAKISGGLSATLVTSKEGKYTVRLTADDGEESDYAEVEVTVASGSGQSTDIDVALTAVPTTDYCAGWEKLEMINTETNNPTKSNAGSGHGWGNWGVADPQTKAHWVQYTWNSPVQIYKNEIFWYSDGGGTQIPKSIALQYQEVKDGPWKDIKMLTNYTDAQKLNQYNTIEMESITAVALRMNVMQKAAGTGILRWKVYSPALESLEPVFLRVAPGPDAPVLPDTVGARTADGLYTDANVEWDPLKAEDFSSTGTDVKADGVNVVNGLFTTANIYVRNQSVTISSVAETAVSTYFGKAPALPKTVKVGYNDGSFDSVNVTVAWGSIDETILKTPGLHELVNFGTVAGTDTKATLKLTVLEPKTEPADKVPLNALIKLVKAIPSGNAYTEASWKSLQDALTAAVKISEDAAASQTQVDEAVTSLQTAMEALVSKTEQVLNLKFEKADGADKIVDSSASKFPITLLGALSAANWATGKNGTALQMDENSGLEMNGVAELAPANITVSYWIKRTDTLTGNNPILWAKNDSTYDGNGFYTNYPVGDGYSSFFVVDGFNAIYVAQNPNDFLPLNEWTHVAVTWNSDTKVGNIYKNGVEQTVDVVGTPSTITASKTAVNRFFANGYPSDAQYPKGLQMDDFQIYSGAMNNEQVGSLYGNDSSDTYSITVENGKADKATAKSDQTVTITANDAPNGKVFDHWTSDSNITFKNSSSAKTTFTMPAKKVTVTAVFKEVAVPKTTLPDNALDQVLTEDEMEAVANGATVSLDLKVSIIENVDPQESALIQQNLKGQTTALILDISLDKILNGVISSVSNTPKPLRITVDIPVEFRGHKKYSLVHVHMVNGKLAATTLSDLDSNPNTITVETNGFSTYAITYSDSSPSKPGSSSSPAPSNNIKQIIVPINGTAATGSGSLLLDTKSFTMGPRGLYDVKALLTSDANKTLKVYSSRDGVARVSLLPNGNYRIEGIAEGTAYIIFEVYDEKGNLLTHASVRIDIQKNAVPHGVSNRNPSVF